MVKTITTEIIRKGIGYQNVECLFLLIKETAKPNFHISNIVREPVVELGEISTIYEGKKKMDPVKLLKNFGDVFNFDIG